MNAEAARRMAEVALLERTRLAALGTDIGLELTAGKKLPETLQLCCEGLVHHLGASFARIWTLNPAGNVLELQASAGKYTHLDGPHARSEGPETCPKDCSNGHH